ncbi:MAG: phosphodiester glycosidase family protein [Lentisphaeria bacterium]|nr:phosphodiester glycosidase family protein [Lentisphaeria bacterium]
MKFTIYLLPVLLMLSTLAAEPQALPAAIPSAEQNSASFDWKNPEVKQLCSGVSYIKMKLTSPRLIALCAVKIDLSTPGMRFKVTGRDKDWGKPMPDADQKRQKYTIRTARRKTRHFIEESRKAGENMVLAVNGPPWGPWKAPWTHKYADWMGLLISDKVLVSYPHRSRPSFVVKDDGSCDFMHITKDADISQIRHAISGFVQIVKDGKLLKIQKKESLAPRTAYGLDSARKTMYILVIDGRQPGYSNGCTVGETARIIRFLGADDALNMDGGGSTTLFLHDQKKLLKMNSYRFGLERTVGANLGVIIDPVNSK